MKIALFGKKIEKDFVSDLAILFKKVEEQQAELFIYEPFNNAIQSTNGLNYAIGGLFNHPNEITSDFDFFISLGGDGTF